MIKSVSLIGCGQIGFRHLQALLNVKAPLNISILETCENAKFRVHKELPKNQRDQISWFDELEKLPNGDVCVVATQATGRANLIEQLVSNGQTRFLIEKMVCQSEEEYNRLLSIIDGEHIKGWVNCVRRVSTQHKQLKLQIIGLENKSFHAFAGNLGLGSLAIHILDFFSWLDGDPKKLELDGSMLHDDFFNNKRGKHLIEFAGILSGRFAETDTLFTINFHPKSHRSLQFYLEADGFSSKINESANSGLILPNDENLGVSTFNVGETLVSETTTLILTQLSTTDDCELPSLAASAPIHCAIFNVLNKHLAKFSDLKSNNCPIT